MSELAPSEKWDRRFLQLADQIATWSKDPSRGVGAVVVTPARQIVATGFNGLPRGFADLPERLQRPVKYDLIVHAELNAIIQCGRNGTSAIGCTVYTSFAPCVHCSLAMVQAGVGRVVTWEPDLEGGDAHWRESLEKSRLVLGEVGIPLDHLRR